jgi:ribosome biogenesis GTPase / thiamine phosphate phosphatase
MTEKNKIEISKLPEMIYTLEELGWRDFFNEAFKKHKNTGFTAGRIAIENRDNYRVLTPLGEMHGEVTGKFLYGSDEKGRFPKVGDWVLLTVLAEEQKSLIHEILPRRTYISRKVAGNIIEEQVMATNLDYLFIVYGMDHPINFKKIERYIAMALIGGCTPIVILNKADLIDVDSFEIIDLKKRLGDNSVIFTSAKNQIGFDELKALIKSGKTIAFSGPSGAGKSSLINCLLGTEIQFTREVREKDRRGRHTTTKREMIMMPGGGILIDTPGIRELYLWDSEEGLEDTFQDIHDLIENCHFSDCRHETEKGCAVIEAVESGTISEERHKNYLKLLKEQEFLEQKQNQQLQSNRKQKWKEINKSMRKFYKNNPKGKGGSNWQ